MIRHVGVIQSAVYPLNTTRRRNVTQQTNISFLDSMFAVGSMNSKNCAEISKVDVYICFFIVVSYAQT